jgi:hypothetical protein
MVFKGFLVGEFLVALVWPNVGFCLLTSTNTENNFYQSRRKAIFLVRERSINFSRLHFL